VIDLPTFIRPNIKRLTAYSSARDEFKGEATIFLDANENPFPGIYNRYPDPHQKKLKNKIASIKNIHPDQLFIGNGSDEAIDLLLRIFCIPSVDEVIIPQPTYGMYEVCAQINDIKVKSVGLASDFDIPAEEILSLVSPATKIIFLCSPNNPTGNTLGADKVDMILKNFNGLVVIDEAYIDFASTPSWANQLAGFNNLIVLQTLSKAWGLASLRIGLCLAHPEIISVLNKIKAPYNISSVAQQLALQALDQTDRKEKQVQTILAQRSYLTEELVQLPLTLAVYPSEANFLFVKMVHAKKVYQHLISKGIIVRDRSHLILSADCLRITVGTAEENQRLIYELKKL